jgi:tetratricopeptide (TPR) repeat protein
MVGPASVPAGGDAGPTDHFKLLCYWALMNTERDLLFAVLALQSDLLNADQFVEACTAWSTQKNGSMSSLLLDWGYLSPTDAKNVDYLVARRVAKHGGDVAASLAGITDERWRWALASLNDPYLQQILTSARAQSGRRAGPTPVEQGHLPGAANLAAFDAVQPRTAHPQWVTYAMLAMVVLVLALVASAGHLLVRERRQIQEAHDEAEAAVRKAGSDRERVESVRHELEAMRQQSEVQARHAEAAEKQLQQTKADAAKYRDLIRTRLLDMVRSSEGYANPGNAKELRRQLEILIQLGGEPGATAVEPAAPAAATDTPGKSPGTSERLDAKKRAVADLEQRAAENPTNLDQQRDLAVAYRQLSDEHLALGQTGPAMETARQAKGVCEKLVAAEGKVAAHRAALAGCHRHIANILHQVGRYKEAEEAIRAALAILEQLAKDEPRSVEYRSALARTHHELSQVFLSTGRFTEAEPGIRTALKIQEEVVLSAPKVAEYWRDLANDYQLLGQLLMWTKRMIEAEAAHQRSVELRDKLVREHPDNAEFRAALASSHQQLAGVFHSTGRLLQAEAACQKAITLREKLAVDFPAVLGYRRDLAVSHRTMGAIQLSAGRLTQAEAAFQKGFAMHTELLKQNSTNAQFRRDLAGTYYELASVAGVQTRLVTKDDREQCIARALELLGKAQSAGFFQTEADRTRLKGDSNFDALRNRDEFKKFVEGLAK